MEIVLKSFAAKIKKVIISNRLRPERRAERFCEARSRWAVRLLHGLAGRRRDAATEVAGRLATTAIERRSLGGRQA